MRKKHWRHDEHGPPWRHKERKSRKERGSTPPWWDKKYWEDWEHGEHAPPMPPWLKHKRDKDKRRHSDKFLFFRFALAFGLFALLGCGFLAALAAGGMLFIQSRPIPHLGSFPGSHPGRWILGLLGLAFLLAIALRRVGAAAARHFTAPLSETMKAADALAEGDLSARVEVGGSDEFRHFARSFNRMAEALETADRQRRELLADVAHELRTPLTVIQGNLEGLRDGVYEATPGHLDLVLDETRNLSRLVDDLRLLTLAEAGQLPLDIQVLDVPQLLNDVRDAFVCQANKAEISLLVDVPQSFPPLLADPQRLGQVLGNLVGNALRHTPLGGKVTLGAAVASDDADPVWVQLWVTDTGEGISAEDLPRIFDRFWRGDPARSHEEGAGSGLGLAIARSLVEAHGGRIRAESGVDQGTTVSCILPLPTTEQYLLNK